MRQAAGEFDELFASGERRLSVCRAVLTEGYRRLARDNCESWSKVVRALFEAMIAEAARKENDPVDLEVLRKILEPAPGRRKASFEAMRHDRGSVEGYFRETLGLSGVEVTGLRRRLLD